MDGGMDAVASGVDEGSGTEDSLSCWFGQSCPESAGTVSTTANRAPHVGQLLRDAGDNRSRAWTR